MFTKMKRAFFKIREELTNGNFGVFIRTQVFINRVATPVEMDMTSLQTTDYHFPDTDYKFIELRLNDLLAAKWHYPISSRRYKALQFLKKGWRCFAVTKDCNVIGDVWCAPYTHEVVRQVHPDLRMLGIQCKDGEAYAFDMLIDPFYRGKNLAVPLHRYLHSSLRNDGFNKVYGYYWNDNLPALWMHRMIKFHELPKRQVSRFFSLIYAKSIDQPGTSSNRPTKDTTETVTKDKS
jgi:GNAT superfamily N-acetyltransferase